MSPARAAKHRRQTPIVSLVLRTGSARLITLPITTLCTLEWAKVVVSHAGLRPFGAISTVSLLVSLLPFSDLGIGTALTNSIADGASGGQLGPRTFATLVHAVRGTILAGFSLGAVGVILEMTGGWAIILGHSASRSLPGIGAGATSVLVIYGIGIPLSLGPRMLIGLHRTASATMIASLQGPLNLFISVILLRYWTGHIAFVAASPPLAAAVASACCWIYARRLLGLRLKSILRTARGRLSISTDLWRVARPTMIATVSFAMAFQLDRIILSHRSTPSALAGYALASQLYSPTLNILSTAGLALWPLFRQTRLQRRAQLFRRAILLFATLGLACAVGLTLLGPIVSDWLAPGQKVAGRLLFLAFGGLILLQSVNVPASMLLNDASNVWQQAWALVCSGILNIGLTIWLAHILGAGGPVLASIIAMALIQVPWMHLAAIRSGELVPSG
jgi:O-antigen/teichoic acid export membrane protein